MQAGGHRFDPGQLHQTLRSAEQTRVASGEPRVRSPERLCREGGLRSRRGSPGASREKSLSSGKAAQAGAPRFRFTQFPGSAEEPIHLIPVRETDPAGSLYIVNMVLTETRQQLRPNRLGRQGCARMVSSREAVMRSQVRAFAKGACHCA